MLQYCSAALLEAIHCIPGSSLYAAEDRREGERRSDPGRGSGGQKGRGRGTLSPLLTACDDGRCDGPPASVKSWPADGFVPGGWPQRPGELAVNDIVQPAWCGSTPFMLLE